MASVNYPIVLVSPISKICIFHLSLLYIHLCLKRTFLAPPHPQKVPTPSAKQSNKGLIRTRSHFLTLTIVNK